MENLTSQFLFFDIYRVIFAIMVLLWVKKEKEGTKMLGNRIVLQRHKMELTQSELANRLHVSASAVGMYEQGRREPSITMLTALSKELEVSIDYLIRGREFSKAYECKNSLMEE